MISVRAWWRIVAGFALSFVFDGSSTSGFWAWGLVGVISCRLVWYRFLCCLCGVASRLCVCGGIAGVCGFCYSVFG